MKIVSFHVREDAFPHTGAVSPTGEVLDFDHPATGLPARTGPFDWLDEDGEHLKAARALLDALAGEFSNELLNQAIRVQLGESTATLREYMMARAFFTTPVQSSIDALLAELDAEELEEDDLEISVPWEDAGA